MPFYEYECSACKFYVEALQKISDPPMVKCPSCGKDTLQRLISAPVFRLKGAGWYETDFKSDQENKRNLADDKEPAAPAEGDKADDKPAKVRTSKMAKKAAVRPAAKSVGKKSGKKSAKQSVKPKVKPKPKTVAKKKALPKPAGKSAKKKAAKKVAKKAARKK